MSVTNANDTLKHLFSVASNEIHMNGSHSFIQWTAATVFYPWQKERIERQSEKETKSENCKFKMLFGTHFSRLANGKNNTKLTA